MLNSYEIFFIIGVLIALSGFTFMISNPGLGSHGLGIMILGIFIAVLMAVILKTKEEKWN